MIDGCQALTVVGGEGMLVEVVGSTSDELGRASVHSFPLTRAHVSFLFDRGTCPLPALGDRYLSVDATLNIWELTLLRSLTKNP